MGDSPDQDLREELRACQHFLVDSEFVRGRRHVFNFASTNVTPSFLKDILPHFYENLPCAATFNLAPAFVLRNKEDGKNRYFNAYGNNLILERSQLTANNGDMLELQNILDDLNIMELSTRERFSNKKTFVFPTKLTVFAALLESVPVGCKIVLLPPKAR